MPNPRTRAVKPTLNRIAAKRQQDRSTISRELKRHGLLRQFLSRKTDLAQGQPE
jgi:IS30 family transposase